MGDSTPAQHGGEYRQFLPDLSVPRFTIMAKQDAHEYAEEFKNSGNPPWLHGLYLHWLKLLKEPFKGVTSDGKPNRSCRTHTSPRTNLTSQGTVRPDLFQVQDEGMPIDAIVAATEAVIAQCNEAQLTRLKYHLDSCEWRTWSNPEFLLSDKGLRLDELSASLRDAIMTVLRTTLSPEGYDKAVGAMRINGFLGELVKTPVVVNEFSYNFVLFGEPATDAPWGFSFYGHHLCLIVFLYKSQVVMSPWFTGAEPNLIDEGPLQGTRILETEEIMGLRLMQSLPPNVQAKAQIYKKMKDPAMPHGEVPGDPP